MFDVLGKYSLSIAWTVILGGLGILLHFFGFDLVSTALVLTGINLLLWIISYFLKYTDGIGIFQLGYYGSIVFLLGTIFFITNLIGFFNSFSIIFSAQIGIIGFIVFIVGLQAEIKDYMKYKLLFFSVGTLLLVLIKQVDNLYFALFIGSVFLLLLYSGIYNILQKKVPIQEQVIDISVKRILAGERINKKTSDKRQDTFFNTISKFLVSMPPFMKQFLEFFNTAIIVVLIVSYISHLGIVQDIYSQILYWFVIICYILNVYVLKKIGYTNFVQRFLIFLVINFAIYISLFSLYQGNISNAMGRLLLRNIFSSLMIFYTHKTPLFYKLLQKSDYIYRLVSVGLSMLVNVVLLIGKTNMASQLLFALIFVYLGIQGMILFYSIRYVQDKYFTSTD